jgi:ERF superfamily
MSENEPTQAVTPQPPMAAAETVFTHSPTFAKLAVALAKAQASYGDLKATSVADAEKYVYKYADLASVLAAVRPALNAQGIALVQGISTQRPAGSGGLVVAVETRLIDQSGEWMATLVKLPSGEVAPQKVGSLTSYLRRYSLLALAGVAAEDDDGKSASEEPPAPRRSHHKPAEPVQPQQSTAPAPEKPKPAKAAPAPLSTKPDAITSRDRALLFKTAKQYSWTEADVKSLIKQLFGYDSTSQLTAVQLGTVLGAIENPGDYGVSFEEIEGVRVVVVRKAAEL